MSEREPRGVSKGIEHAGSPEIVDPLYFHFLCPESREEEVRNLFAQTEGSILLGFSPSKITAILIGKGDQTVIEGHNAFAVSETTVFGEILRDLAERHIAGYSSATKLIADPTPSAGSKSR